MSEVRDTATVHVSETVSGLRKGRGPDRAPRSSKVVHTKVHPWVWAAARQVVQGPGGYARIQIVNEGTVVVR